MYFIQGVLLLETGGIIFRDVVLKGKNGFLEIIALSPVTLFRFCKKKKNALGKYSGSYFHQWWVEGPGPGAAVTATRNKNWLRLTSQPAHGLDNISNAKGCSFSCDRSLLQRVLKMF